MIRTRTIRPALLALLTLSLAAPAHAGLFHRRARCRPARACQAAPCAARRVSTVSTPLAPAAAPAASGDPSGFLGWLNATRARHGLGAVGWDDGLASDAAANSSRGLGHAYLGRARRQNAGAGDLGGVQAAWLRSPAHASALLDPSITRVALANVGGVWTYSAY